MIAKALVPSTFSTWKIENHLLANAAVILAGALFLAVAARIEIPLPFSLIPITGQTFAVLILGASLGSVRAGLSTVFYLAGGGLGLRFFSGGAMGWSYLSGATAGYLFGFVLAALLMGWLSERGVQRRFGNAWLLFLAGEGVIFFCGTLWLSTYVGFQSALVTGLLPFVPGEIVKTTLAASLLPILTRK